MLELECLIAVYCERVKTCTIRSKVERQVGKGAEDLATMRQLGKPKCHEENWRPERHETKG
jgi:hypothetical protein